MNGKEELINPDETLGHPFDRHDLEEELQNYQTYSNPAAILAEVLDMLGLTSSRQGSKNW